MKKEYIILLIIGAIIIFLIFLPTYTKTATKLQELKLENKRLESEIERIKESNSELAIKIKRLKEDPVYIEKIAREKLGLAREGEIIYKIEEGKQ